MFVSGHKDSVSSLAFSGDGQLLASGSFDGTVSVWDTSSQSLKCIFDGPASGIEVLLLSVSILVYTWGIYLGIYGQP